MTEPQKTQVVGAATGRPPAAGGKRSALKTAVVVFAPARLYPAAKVGIFPFSK